MENVGREGDSCAQNTRYRFRGQRGTGPCPQRGLPGKDLVPGFTFPPAVPEGHAVLSLSPPSGLWVAS